MRISSSVWCIGIYSAMLNSSSKWLAGVVASILILDYLATCVVSAATAAAYLAAEVALPDQLPAFALAIIIMVAFALIAFLGIRESSTVALIIFMFHLITMLTLLIASFIHWGQVGNATLIANWNYPYPENSSAVKMIFNGFCVGLLGVTGYEVGLIYAKSVEVIIHFVLIANITIPRRQATILRNFNRAIFQKLCETCLAF
jgi:amino acid transporter